MNNAHLGYLILDHDPPARSYRPDSRPAWPSTRPARSQQKLSNEPTNSNARAKQPFLFLALPPELRLNIHDIVFTPLVKRHEGLNPTTLYPYTDWPRHNDFTPYTHLLLTCRELRAEVEDHWRKQYARKCTLYFREIASLHRVTTSLLKLGEEYAQASFILRRRAPSDFCDGIPDYPPQGQSVICVHPIDDLVQTFMEKQAGWHKEWNQQLFWQGDFGDLEKRPGTYAMDDGLTWRVRKQEGSKAGAVVGTVDFPRLPYCEIWVHKSSTTDDDWSTLLHGTFANATSILEDYDQLQGWEMLLWWMEAQKRGFPGKEGERRKLYR